MTAASASRAVSRRRGSPLSSSRPSSGTAVAPSRFTSAASRWRSSDEGRSAPVENQFHTFIGRVDYRINDNQSLFGRLNVQDDTINAAPQFPGQDPRSQTLLNNMGAQYGQGYLFGRPQPLEDTLRVAAARASGARAG